MQVGDPLELRFDIIDPLSPYEIFVRDLVAKDGNDQNQGWLLFHVYLQISLWYGGFVQTAQKGNGVFFCTRLVLF